MTWLSALCNGLLFAKQLLDVSAKALAISDGCNDEGQRRNQNVHRADHPEPGPVLFLTGEFAHGNGLEELGREDFEEIADGIVSAGTPDVRGVLVADVEEIFGVTGHGNETQLHLENLIEDDKQHNDQEDRRRS